MIESDTTIQTAFFGAFGRAVATRSERPTKRTRRRLMCIESETFASPLLRLLGFDDNKLTYYHAGRLKQLSQFGGTVIEKLVA